MQDKEMLNELIMESREHLEKIEPDLLQLEEKGSDVPDELINSVFRAVHSIKGGFGFFGIDTIVNLSHAMENVMSRIRDKKLIVSSEVSEALLQGVDRLRVLIDDVAHSDSIPIAEELEKLSPFLEPDIKKDKNQIKNDEVDLSDIDQDIRERHPSFGDKQILEAVRTGNFIYQVTVDPKKDIADKKLSYATMFTHWDKFGSIVDCNPPQKILVKRKNRSPGKNEISIIITTVLEPDLIGEALEIPQEQIYAFDLTPWKKKYLAEQKNIHAGENKKTSQDKQLESFKLKSGTGIEEALRVKVGLLNNLMNYAGELVLSRNQLMQNLNRKFSETPDAENIIKTVMDAARHSFSNRQETLGTNVERIQQTIEDVLSVLEKKLRETLSFSMVNIQGINAITQNIDMVTSVLQENIMQTRMQPISVVFSKFPRVIRDLAKKMEKEISLTLIGQDVELDKSIIELLSDPLTHLIRNCADHGIEIPEEREQAGKKRKGEVVLRAYQEGGKVIIEIEDDGAGINPETVKAKAIEKQIINRDKADAMTIMELQALIFSPGFSTAKFVSDVSGRGVGMDVVKTNIERLGGTIDVKSEVGKGTKICMKLPLTLAIIPSLIVVAEQRRFAIPQMGLEEVVRIRAKDITRKIESVHDSEVLRLRGKLLPLVRLSDVLGISGIFIHSESHELITDQRKRWSDRRSISIKDKDGTVENIAASEKERRISNPDRRESLSNAVKVIVLRMEKNLYGLVVDDVLDSEEIVVKPLPDYIKSCQCYAGATIMGDGKVVMILDPNGIANMADLKLVNLEDEIAAEKEHAEKEATRNLENIILFNTGGREHFAIHLSSVARVEKRSIEEIETVGDKEFLKYENSSLPLVHLEKYLPVSSQSEILPHIFIIVPKNIKHPVGIVASKVEDTIQTELTLDKENIRATGIAGSAIIDSKLTIILDIPGLLKAVEPEMFGQIGNYGGCHVT